MDTVCKNCQTKSGQPSGQRCLLRNQATQSWSHITEQRPQVIPLKTVQDSSGLISVSPRPQYLFYHAVKRFFLPTVYSQGLVSTDNPETTTIQRLENARPRIVISEKDVTDYLEQESGMQRVKDMFTKRENSIYREDVDSIVQLTRNCSLMVFIVTSVLGGNAAREKFIEKNKHKVYATKFTAFRAFNDAVVFGSLRFGLKWCLKTAFFTGLFMTTASAISVYRNKSSVLEYTVAGSVTCALLRMNVGLRGMFAGGVIGGAFGLVAGGAMYAVMYATNTTQQQRRYWLVEQMLRHNRESELFKADSVPVIASESVEAQTA